MSQPKLDIQGIGMTSQRTRNRLMQLLADMGIQHKDLLTMMSKVPRHLFVDEALASRAYENTALPIGHGQTISHPFIVARMTELALTHDQPLDRVLEIGTGSGYQAAIIAPFTKELYTIEYLEPLHQKAKQLLNDLGYGNIRTLLQDGTLGLPNFAPFDAILIAAAAKQPPPHLLEQLNINGQLIMPVGAVHQDQVLTVIKRLDVENFETTTLDTVQFVPLVNSSNSL